MGTTNLIRSLTEIRKNGQSAGSALFALVYDEGLNVFKVIHWRGDIWATFNPSQVTAVEVSTKGSDCRLNVGANLEGGDAYWFSFKTGSSQTGEDIKAWISKKVQKESALDEIFTRMKTREKVPLSEVASILAEHGLPSSKEDCRKVVEYGITKKGI